MQVSFLRLDFCRQLDLNLVLSIEPPEVKKNHLLFISTSLKD